MGMAFLRDVETLRSGERWHDKLIELIARADILQLYWSDAARQSPHVAEEYRLDGFGVVDWQRRAQTGHRGTGRNLKEPLQIGARLCKTACTDLRCGQNPIGRLSVWPKKTHARKPCFDIGFGRHDLATTLS